MTQPPSVLLGLIGAGIQASRTPAMHEREADAQGLRLQYKLIDLTALNLTADALPELLIAAERMGFAGLNITHPCKQSVISLLHTLSEDARTLGAVNTVTLRNGRRTGHNTDLFGFAEAFRRAMSDAPRKRVVQLGAGGAGSAVAYAAMTLGVEQLTIIDVEPARANTLAERLCSVFGAGRAVTAASATEAMAGADGLINTTPIGMDKYPGLPLPENLLHPVQWVAEIIYFPMETALLRVARQRGCRTMDGGGMAVFQASEAFRLFTGVDPDTARMQRHFSEMGT